MDPENLGDEDADVLKPRLIPEISFGQVLQLAGILGMIYLYISDRDNKVAQHDIQIKAIQEHIRETDKVEQSFQNEMRSKIDDIKGIMADIRLSIASKQDR